MVKVISYLPDGGQVVLLPADGEEASCVHLAGDQFVPAVRLRNVVEFRQSLLAETIAEFNQHRQQMLDAGNALLEDGDDASRRFDRLEHLADHVERMRDWAAQALDELEVVLPAAELADLQQARYSEASQRSLRLGIEAFSVT